MGTFWKGGSNLSFGGGGGWVRCIKAFFSKGLAKKGLQNGGSDPPIRV